MNKQKVGQDNCPTLSNTKKETTMKRKRYRDPYEQEVKRGIALFVLMVIAIIILKIVADGTLF